MFATADPFTLPPQMQSLLAVGMWVVICAGLIGTVAAVVSIWANLRRRPNADQTFATKAELLAAENRMSVRFDVAISELRVQQQTIFNKIDATNTSMGKYAAEFERALGKVEGLLNAKPGAARH